MTEGPLYKIEEAAPLLRMSETKLRRMIRDKEISYRRIGRRIFLTQSDIDGFIEASAVDPAS